MSLDGAFLHLIKKEISPLIGARIDKIHMPSRDEIVISLRAFGGTRRLLISANPSSPRICLTENAPENPATPPMFCMLLRKHLASSKLIDIRQNGLERILFLDFEAVTEIGDVVLLTIVVEIMGRHSNVILVGDGKIIDSVKRITDDISSIRRVLPNAEYQLPPRRERIVLIEGEITKDILKPALEPLMEKRLDKSLIEIVEGISPIIAREVANFSSHDTTILVRDLTIEMWDRLVFFLKKITNILIGVTNPNFTILRDLNGKPKDFTFINVEQYGIEMLSTSEERASAVLDKFFAEGARKERLKQRSNELQKMLLNTYERILRKLEIQKQELLNTQDRDKYRVWGDIVNANLYQIQKGQMILKAENFYTGELVEIPLDKMLTPAKNAQKLYHEYKKLDNAEKMLIEQIKKGENELEYIDSVFDSVTRASGDSVVNEIRLELAEQGYLKSVGKGKTKQKSLPPMKFTSSDGYQILVGRNNRQNDQLTLKTAKPWDLWLHTKDIAGSHVIVKKLDEGEIPSRTIEEAAIVAATCSKAKDSSQVPVDFVEVRFVKKPSGAKPGMVIFTNNKTLYVKPEQEIFERLAQNDSQKARD